jgi:hypothetical protein
MGFQELTDEQWAFIAGGGEQWAFIAGGGEKRGKG